MKKNSLLEQKPGINQMELNGAGCKTCPVKNCDTLQYRGSRCAALRAKHGLGDPRTNAERIQSFNNGELKTFICGLTTCEVCRFATSGGCTLEHWLEQPAEGEGE